MGTYFQTYGDTLPIQIYIQHTWGQVANTKYMYNIYGDRLLIQKNIHGISLITMHGMREGVHSTLGSSPGDFLFNRDMFLNIQLIVDWHTITQRREHLIHEKLMRENQKRRATIMLHSKWYLRKNRSLKNWAKEQVVHTK